MHMYSVRVGDICAKSGLMLSTWTVLVLVVAVAGVADSAGTQRASARPPRTTPALSPAITRNLTALAGRSGARNR